MSDYVNFEYRDYINTHVSRVSDTYYNKIRPVLIEEDIPSSILDKIEKNILSHDDSKFTPSEFGAYSRYYTDKVKYPRSSEEYLQAWNHHQKSNPHHWQYWVLVTETDKEYIIPLDIPLEYIIEMLCDWHAAGIHYGNSGYDWYQFQKDRMILSERTREIVEKYIEYFK